MSVTKNKVSLIFEAVKTGWFWFRASLSIIYIGMIVRVIYTLFYATELHGNKGFVFSLMGSVVMVIIGFWFIWWSFFYNWKNYMVKQIAVMVLLLIFGWSFYYYTYNIPSGELKVNEYQKNSYSKIVVVNNKNIFRPPSDVSFDPFHDQITWFPSATLLDISGRRANTQEGSIYGFSLKMENFPINPTDELLTNPAAEQLLAKEMFELDDKIVEGFVDQAKHMTPEELQRKIIEHNNQYNVFWDTDPTRQSAIYQHLSKLGVGQWDGYLQVTRLTRIIPNPST